MKTYVTVRGTGEHFKTPTTMLGRVAGMVGPAVEWVDVDYPASIAVFNPQGNPAGPSEAQSRATGVENLVAAIRATPHLVILSGYSLGALVVSDFLEAQAHGEYADCEVSAVVNIANPARRRGQSYGLPSSGWGLDGEHGAWPAGLPTYEIANPVDGITSAPGNSPWRLLAREIREISLTVQGLNDWFADLINQLNTVETALSHTSAPWTDPGFFQAWWEAPAWLRGYLFDGQHDRAYGDTRWRDSSNAPISGMQLAADVVRGYA
ncbi:PE-PPE domain-containing protein [Gordonia sp. NPDC003424]